MDHLAPLGPVYQAGTLSGNPLATAAGLAALDLLDDGAYGVLARPGRRWPRGLQAAFDGAGLTARCHARRALVGLYFGDHLPVDYADARATDEAAYAAFFHALLARGVALAPGAYEVAVPRPGPRRRGRSTPSCEAAGGASRRGRRPAGSRPASAPRHRDRKHPSMDSS